MASLKPISIEEADHDYFNSFLKSKLDIEKRLTVPLREASVLVIGSGYKYPDVLLYSCFVKEVYGLDVEDAFFRDGFWALYNSLRKRGKTIIFSFLKTFAERNGLRKNYYKRLSNLANRALNHEAAKLIKYDGTQMPFEDNTFDVILSTAVLEHVIDLDGFFKELSRVTKPGALSYHLYHNYYSFSGAHLPKQFCMKHPWGHLRGVYKTDPNFLNKASIEQTAKYFSNSFEVNDIFHVSKDHSKKGIDESFEYEGQDLLSDKIRNQLIDYSEEQLLTRGYLLIGTKMNMHSINEIDPCE